MPRQNAIAERIREANQIKGVWLKAVVLDDTVVDRFGRKIKERGLDSDKLTVIDAQNIWVESNNYWEVLCEKGEV